MKLEHDSVLSCMSVKNVCIERNMFRVRTREGHYAQLLCVCVLI